MEYRPQTQPKIETLDELTKYLEQELATIARTFNEVDILRLRVLHVAPVKPREGMVVAADGTNWNPGSGVGLYVYLGGAWVLAG